MDNSLAKTAYKEPLHDPDDNRASQPYTLLVNGTTVRVYFAGTADLGSRLADVFGSISKYGNTKGSIP